MNRVLLGGVVFSILTIVGARFVLLSNGKVNAGIAVIPMIFAVLCINTYRKDKKN